jgi:hypothetical protein
VPEVDEHQYLVTTAGLADVLLLWERRSRITNRSDWSDRMRTCSRYLEEASQLVREIGNLESADSERDFSSTRDLDENCLKTWQIIHLSAIILGEQIYTALKTCYGADINSGTFHQRKFHQL